MLEAKTIVIEYIGDSREEEKKLSDALNEKFTVVRHYDNFFEISADKNSAADLRRLKRSFLASGFSGRIVDYDPSPHNSDFMVISC